MMAMLTFKLLSLCPIAILHSDVYIRVFALAYTRELSAPLHIEW